MVLQPKRRQIAYRCPECGTATVGMVGKFALRANMLRLKCTCEKESSLDISIANDARVRLSVPCLYCKQNHGYTITESIFFERDKFLLNCPYSGMDIAFIGDEETVSEELSRTERELETILKGFEADSLEDIQPSDMNEDEILPDPAVYDTVRFLVKDLEEEGKIECPCAKGEGYDLRFADGGIDVFCPSCGASVLLPVTSVQMSEELLSLDGLKLR